jgi:hypothetical protein
VAPIGNKKNAYSRLMEKPDRKRRLEKPMYRWEGNIKIEYTSISNK